MSKKAVLKLNDLVSIEKANIRKKRKERNKERLAILFRLDDLLDRVKHLPQILENQKDTEDIDSKNAIFVGDLSEDDAIIVKEIYFLRNKLSKLSNKKGYEVDEMSQDDGEDYLPKKKKPVRKKIDKSDYVKGVKKLDSILKPVYVAELRSYMTLTEVSDHFKVEYKSLVRWCETRGVNEILEKSKNKLIS